MAIKGLNGDNGSLPLLMFYKRNAQILFKASKLETQNDFEQLKRLIPEWFMAKTTTEGLVEMFDIAFQKHFDMESFYNIEKGHYRLTWNIAKMLFETNIQNFIPPGDVSIEDGDDKVKECYYALTHERVHPRKKFSEEVVAMMAQNFTAHYNDTARRVLMHSVDSSRLLLDETYYSAIQGEKREQLIEFLLENSNKINAEKEKSVPEETTLLI